MIEELRVYFRDWYDEHGVLDLDELYEDLARPEHPLHGRYTWDTIKAAREYVKQEIARDIRLVEVSWVADNGRTERVREYMSQREIGTANSGYTAARDALRDPVTLARLEANLKLEIKRLRRNFGHLKAYAEILRREIEDAS